MLEVCRQLSFHSYPKKCFSRSVPGFALTGEFDWIAVVFHQNLKIKATKNYIYIYI